MRIFRKVIKFEITSKGSDLVKCSYCGSERLDEIGDVLECIDCKAVKALN